MAVVLFPSVSLPISEADVAVTSAAITTTAVDVTAFSVPLTVSAGANTVTVTAAAALLGHKRNSLTAESLRLEIGSQ